MIDRVGLRTLAWQPKQANVELVGQAQVVRTAMIAVAIKEKPERAAGSDAVTQPAQKALEVGQTLVAADHHHTPAGAQINGPKRARRAFSPLIRTSACFPPKAHASTPWRQVTQDRFIQGEQPFTGGQIFRGAYERPFFWAKCYAGSTKTKRARFQRKPAAGRRRRRAL